MNHSNTKGIFLTDGKRFICQFKSSAENSHFVLTIFWITILFQLTTLKYIWDIEGLSRFFNLAALLIVSVYAAYSVISHQFNKNIWQFYILPGSLVFIGMLLNITLNSINNYNLISYFGLTIPWAVYLAMPFLLKKNAHAGETLWHYFYYFMLVTVFLGLLDYFLTFSGLSSLRIIATPYGEFLAGRFSILHLLGDGSAHNRFHACFAEPGTLAMFLLPVIVYAYYKKRYIGLAIFMVGFYLSYSLGGMISFALIIPLVLFISTNKRRIPLVIPAFIVIIVSAVIVITFMGDFTVAYDEKDSSRTDRTDNFWGVINNLPTMLVNNPIGVKLAEDTASNIKNENYYGSNFTPGNALQMGGIMAFLGYLVVLLVSLVVALLSIIRKSIPLEEKIVFCSLIVLFPFIFQRTTVWDSAIFAFLFAPSIIRFLQSRSRVRILLEQPQLRLGVSAYKISGSSTV